MATEIKVPPLGESVTEGTVARWLKKVGDSVKIDETLIEFETDKVTVDVPSPASGVLSEISAPEGANVAVGGLLGVIAEGAAGAAAAPAKAAAPAAEAPKPAAPAAAAKPAQTDLDRSGPAARKLVEENKL